MIVHSFTDPAFVMRSIRAAAPVTPASFGTLNSWWKADSLSLSDGTAVGNGSTTDWLDSSGNGNTLTQPTSGQRPLFKTAIYNGLPTIRFDASDDRLHFTNAFSRATQTAFTIMAVCQANGDQIVYGHLTTGNNQIRRLRSGANVISAYFGVQDTPSSTFSTTLGNLCCCFWRRTTGTGNVITYRENKTSRGVSTDTGQVDLNRMGVTSFGSKFNGDMCESAIWTTLLSDADCDSLYDNYLKTRWGLP